jgi:hypothetical protein
MEKKRYYEIMLLSQKTDGSWRSGTMYKETKIGEYIEPYNIPDELIGKNETAFVALLSIREISRKEYDWKMERLNSKETNL